MSTDFVTVAVDYIKLTSWQRTVIAGLATTECIANGELLELSKQTRPLTSPIDMNSELVKMIHKASLKNEEITLVPSRYEANCYDLNLGQLLPSVIQSIGDFFCNDYYKDLAREGKLKHLKFAAELDDCPIALRTALLKQSRVPGWSYSGYDESDHHARFITQVRDIYYYDISYLKEQLSRFTISDDEFNNTMKFIAEVSEINDYYEPLLFVDTYFVDMMCDRPKNVTKAITSDILELIDSNSDKLPEGEYLKLMTMLKELNDSIKD